MIKINNNLEEFINFPAHSRKDFTIKVNKEELNKINLKKELNINDQLSIFNRNNEIYDYDFFNFYNWFFDAFDRLDHEELNDRLEKESKKLFKKLEEISATKKFDCEKSYSFFENRMSRCGELHNKIKICSTSPEEVIYTIVINRKNLNGDRVCEIWGKENNFAKPLIFGEWNEIKKFFIN